MFLIYPHAFLTPPLYFSSFVLGQLLGKNCPHGLTPKAGRDIRGTSGIRPTLQWKDRAAFPLNAWLLPWGPLLSTPGLTFQNLESICIILLSKFFLRVLFQAYLPISCICNTIKYICVQI